MEHSIRLARGLLAHSEEIRIVASGSDREREQERLPRLYEAVDHPRLRLLPADLSIPELTAVLQRCSPHIGPDSGVMNLAAAVGVPTISFFCDQAGYKSWLPVGDSHRAFAGTCHCVDHRNAPCVSSGRADCLAALTPDRAIKVALQRRS